MIQLIDKGHGTSGPLGCDCGGEGRLSGGTEGCAEEGDGMAG